MKFDIVTIFPAMFEAPLAEGVVARGVAAGLRGPEGPRPARLHDGSAPRRGRRAVRRRPGHGAEAGAARSRAVEHDRAPRADGPAAVVLMSPQGRALTQQKRRGWPGSGTSCILCGRYEGVDDRIREQRGDRGDFDRRLRAERRRAGGPGDRGCGRAVGAGCGGGRAVGGARTRSRAGCSTTRTSRGRRSFAGGKVPDVLLSGHHAEIRTVAQARGPSRARWNGGPSCWPARARRGRAGDSERIEGASGVRREQIMSAIEAVEKAR